MLIVRAEFPIDPAQRTEAIEAFETLAEQSRAEDGVIEYRVAFDIEDENRVRFFEQYEDEAAFGAHAESDHFATFNETLPTLLAGEPTVIRYEVESESELDL